MLAVFVASVDIIVALVFFVNLYMLTYATFS